MRRILVLALGTALATAGLGLAAQAAEPAKAASTWKTPRNAMGQPDLSGYWSNATLTPLTRNRRLSDKATLTALANGLGHDALVRYDRGKVIMVQGQAAAFMYVVLEGRVAISLRGATVERVGAGGVFGEMALVDQVTRAANAAAETDCVLLAINRPVFMNLVKADPGFGVSLLTAVAERVRALAAAAN